jgi:hypothetical protein
MNTCPDIGSWRAWLDGETAITGPDEHLATCGDCAVTVAGLRRSAGFASTRLAVLEPRAVREPRVEPPSAPPAAPATRRAGWIRAAAAAAVVVGFMSTPFGQDTAEAFLSAFRVRQFNLVQVTAAEAMQTAEVLWSLGTVEGEPVPVPDFSEPVTIVEAEAATGLDLPDPGIDGPAEAVVLPASTMRWTFDAEMVAAHIAAEGADVAVPEGLDATTVVLDRAEAVVVAYGESLNNPELIVGVSGPVEATAEGGLSLEEVRSFLLSLPGLPEGLVAQLGSIEDWTSTLPIPIEEGSAEQVQLGQVEAVRYEIDGWGAGYVWVDGDTIVGIAAERGFDGLEDIAADLAG